MLGAAGVDLTTAAALMGHKDVRLTARAYTDHAQPNKRDAVQALPLPDEGLLGASKPSELRSNLAMGENGEESSERGKRITAE